MTSQHSELGSVDNGTENNRIVYDNRRLRTITDSGNETVPAKHKSVSMKCSNCKSRILKALKHHYSLRVMKRLYIKDRNSWKAIGWYCSFCGSIVLDGYVAPPSFVLIPEPRITVLNNENSSTRT